MKFSRILALCFFICIGWFICGGGCGENKYICIGEDGTDCHTFQQYGLIDSEKENTNVKYEAITGNIVWAVILSETLAVPLIVVGWYLYEPVGTRGPEAGTPGAL